jgi:hypothetical protein
MNPSLSSDTCIFQFLRLRDIVTLIMVAKQLRRIALSKKYWYTISDTEKILYNFVRKILQSGIPESTIPESTIPESTIPLGSPELLVIIPKSPEDCMKFYKYFTNYQYLYVDKKNHATNISFIKSLKGIYIYIYRKCLHNRCEILTTMNTVTEFIAPGHRFDCKDIIRWYPCIEKLNISNITTVELLKQIQLKYLKIGPITMSEAELIISSLPNTIESLIIPYEIDRIRSLISASSLFNLLNQFPHLRYLKINLSFSNLWTTLNICTVHLVIPINFLQYINIDMPNVQNIIVTSVVILEEARKLLLQSHNAITCQIINRSISTMHIHFQ